MSQKGRSMQAFGHGSSGAGPSMARGFGEPGLLGAWRSVSNRYRPPVPPPAAILSMKAVATGVGRLGKAGSHALGPKRLLDGGPGERSDPSSIADTDRFRLFMLLRLDDEKFFLWPGRDTE